MAATETADVLVVGGGVNGLATALELRALGIEKVVVLERHLVGAGQSGRAAGIVRALVAHPKVSAWQLASQSRLLNFSERFDVPVPVDQPGYLLVSRSEELPIVQRAVETATTAGAEASQIDAAAALELQPGLRRGEDVIYAYEPGALHVDPMVTTHAMSVAARRSGVSLLEDCAVEEITVEGDRVTGVRCAEEPAPRGAG